MALLEIRNLTRRFGDQSGEWDRPLRVLAGEQLYPIAKKLCE